MQHNFSKGGHTKSPHRSSRLLVPPTPQQAGPATHKSGVGRSQGIPSTARQVPSAVGASGMGNYASTSLSTSFANLRRSIPSFAQAGDSPQQHRADEQGAWYTESGYQGGDLSEGSSSEEESEASTDDFDMGGLTEGISGGFTSHGIAPGPTATQPTSDYVAFEQTFETGIRRSKDLFSFLSEDVVDATLPQIAALEDRLSRSAARLEQEMQKLVGVEARGRQ
ncbi:hypothetical protein JCM11641_002314, partial [Rhodosporidiobolus odoratus]